MLYVSLVVSAILLIAANWAARGKHPIAGTVGAGLVAAFGPTCLMLALPAVMLQAAFLCVALPVLLVPRRGRPLYLPASVLATLAAYGIATWSAAERGEQLRQRFPVESLEDRLPPRPPTGQTAPADPSRLDYLETTIERETSWLGGRREEALRRLHEDKVGQFVNSYGFGVGRMSEFTGEYALRRGTRDGPPIPQPGAGSDVSPPDRWDPATGPGFERLHMGSALDFLNPAGFGRFEGRERVIGFQPHGFSRVPDPAERWAVARIDLVGLLLKPEPRVYVSEHLPRMDELREAPTRRPDAFEAEGLAALRRGEDLYVRGTDRQVRMLGSIRATKQCLGCHGGDRGDLLGAFSYALRRGD